MDTRSERVARRFELPVLVVALLVLPVIAVERANRGERAATPNRVSIYAFGGKRWKRGGM